MTPEQYEICMGFLDKIVTTQYALPVASDQVTLVTLGEIGERKYFELNFLNNSPRPVLSPVDGYTTDPADIGIPSSPGAMVLQLAPGPQIEFLSNKTEFISLSPMILAPPDDLIKAGTVIGTTTDSRLQVEFMRRTTDGSQVESVDPALMIRVLALFSEVYFDVLTSAIVSDAVGQFRQASLTAAYDAAPLGMRKRMLRDALVQERQILIDNGLPQSAELELRLNPPAIASTDRNTLRDNFEALIAADPDGFVIRRLTGMNINVAILRADRYEVDLVDLRNVPSFGSLADPLSHYKLTINGPYFSLYVCPKLWPPRRAWVYSSAFLFDQKGMTKGHIKLRDGNLGDGDCPGSDSRYYFLQKTDGSFEFGSGVVPNGIPDLAIALDNLSGIILNGLARSGDSDYGDFQGKSKTQGLPFFGWLEKTGVKYFLIVIRPDLSFTTASNVTASFDDVVSYLNEMGVRDAIWTDGDDSVGMIADGQLHVGPGWKKDGSMPLAIGFRKVI
jgi:hypothetical protein